jgi:predicted metal-binding membrane protein
VGRDDGSDDAAIPGAIAVALPLGRRQDRRHAPRPADRAGGHGYFFVWTVFGMAAFPLGAALAAVEMQLPALARAVPIAIGVVVLIAGALQFTERAGCRPIAAMIQERSTYVFSFCRPANFPHSFAGPLWA